MRKSVSTSSSTRYRLSISSINEQSENGDEFEEVGLPVEGEQENSNENINNGQTQDRIVVEESNENTVEDENFCYINDDKREVGIHEDKEINGS